MEVLERIPSDEEDHRNRATPSPKQDNFFAIGSHYHMSPDEQNVYSDEARGICEDSKSSYDGDGERFLI